jgi:hypothetical protein
MYQKATRMKLRFISSKGELTIEQLWELPLTKLDAIYKDLHEKIKKEDTVSLLGTLTSESVANKENELRIAIVKDVVAVRLKEKEEKENAAALASERKRYDDLIANKKLEEDSNASIEELQAKRDALGN